MKISLNWLKRYIHLDMSVDRLSEILTDIGLEVEGVEKVESIKGGLHGVVVGEILECEKHPNADKLKVTKVDVGTGEILDIVCGAPNVAKGQKVMVATVGSCLYLNGEEELKIKKGKIRGEVSEGMICAEDELGIGNDHAGIIVLPAETQIGMPARAFYQITDDVVYDIGLTPNRSDATCHLGVAKDLAAYLRINEDWKGSVSEPVIAEFMVDNTTSKIKVELLDPKACPRYSGISFSNVKVGPSPQWMRDLLTAIGVRSINNIVDITNFILHEYGQPLHAFDATKITDGIVRVQKLPEGTPFLSLDEKERKLSSEDLMICDGANTGMCIGGVFGGLNSGVVDSTTQIFLEAAHFEASGLRKTSTRHLLRTDAAKVFEKGSDPNITITALKRAALLFKDLAGAEVTSEIIDVYPEPIRPKEIHLNYNRIKTLMGADIEVEEIHNILRAMDMELRPVDSENFVVSVPTNKADVIREVDVIEEVLRIYGFNKVPIPAQLKTAISFQDYPTKRDIKNKVADLLCNNGFNEMMGLSLIESKLYTGRETELVFINNTSNVHLDIMRPDALLSGLISLSHNINHQQTDLKLFEFGKTYIKDEDQYLETEFLSLFLSGNSNAEHWSVEKVNKTDFFKIKQWVELILSRINLNSYQLSELENSDAVDYGLKYHRGPQSIVEFYKVAKASLKKCEVKQEVYFAEFNLKALVKAASKSRTTTTEINKYPSTSRDLALVIDENVKFSDIISITKNTDKKLISDINLFDIYKNEEHLGAGKKSYAVKFVFEDKNKTLKDKEVDKVVNKLIENFGSKLGAVIRK